MKPKSALGTGEVAKFCGVCGKTVANWMELPDDPLPGFRVPGSKHRRIMARDLVAFLEKHGMPVVEELRLLGEMA